MHVCPRWCFNCVCHSDGVKTIGGVSHRTLCYWEKNQKEEKTVSWVNGSCGLSCGKLDRFVQRRAKLLLTQWQCRITFHVPIVFISPALLSHQGPKKWFTLIWSKAEQRSPKWSGSEIVQEIFFSFSFFPLMWFPSTSVWQRISCETFPQPGKETSHLVWSVHRWQRGHLIGCLCEATWCSLTLFTLWF